jgi:FKBP-type peptidyl-prolyl cis-trans isomerase
MRLYSDLEVETLINEISEAALEAIEQAAGEAAKAAVLAVIEREAAALHEAAHQQAEAKHWKLEAERQKQMIKETKKAGVKNTVITIAVCFVGGLAVGVGGTLIIGGK